LAATALFALSAVKSGNHLDGYRGSSSAEEGGIVMVSIELVFWLIVIIFGAVGFIRGWSKEVGSTLGILIALEIIERMAPILVDQINKFAPNFIPMRHPSDRLFILNTAIFLAIVFFSYQGETLALTRKVSGWWELVGGVVAGALNGYLIAGSIWYFLRQESYAIAAFVGRISQPDPNTFLLKPILNFLPPDLLPEPLLIVIVLVLLLLRLVP
jgi:uncharacterized membrane protein required for colicin V production